MPKTSSISFCLPDGIGGDQVNLEELLQGMDSLCNTGKEHTVQCECAVHIAYQVLDN